MREHLQAEGQAAAGDRAADSSETDDAETGTGDPHRREVGHVPAALAHRAVEVDDPPQEGGDERDRVVGHLLRAVAGDVRAPDAGCRERLDVEVLVAGRVRGDRAQPGKPGELGLPDEDLRPDEETDDVVALGALAALDAYAQPGERLGRDVEIPRGIEDEHASLVRHGRAANRARGGGTRPGTASRPRATQSGSRGP